MGVTEWIRKPVREPWNRAHSSGRVLREFSLRQPDGSDLRFLRFASWADMGMVDHLITTRDGGVSRGVLRSMNLSFSRGDEPERVAENYRRVAAALRTEPGRFVSTDQTHTVTVRRVYRDDAGKGITRPRDWHDVDGLVTDVPGLVLSAYFADCVPLFFIDPVHRAIGLSHSGWRGTLHRMGAVTVARMREEFGTSPEDLYCGVGPSICGSCYEVGEDVAQPFATDMPEVISPAAGRPGKYLLDLWLANRRILEAAGVRAERIEVTDICTCCNPDRLFSHRASKGRRGNAGAFLMLRER
jgi:YfiH family protein